MDHLCLVVIIRIIRVIGLTILFLGAGVYVEQAKGQNCFDQIAHSSGGAGKLTLSEAREGPIWGAPSFWRV